MYDISRVSISSRKEIDTIEYDEIIAATEADARAGRSYTLEETETFGHAVVARLLQHRSPSA